MSGGRRHSGTNYHFLSQDQAARLIALINHSQAEDKLIVINEQLRILRILLSVQLTQDQFAQVSRAIENLQAYFDLTDLLIKLAEAHGITIDNNFIIKFNATYIELKDLAEKYVEIKKYFTLVKKLLDDSEPMSDLSSRIQETRRQELETIKASNYGYLLQADFQADKTTLIHLEAVAIHNNHIYIYFIKLANKLFLHELLLPVVNRLFLSYKSTDLTKFASLNIKKDVPIEEQEKKDSNITQFISWHKENKFGLTILQLSLAAIKVVVGTYKINTYLSLGSLERSTLELCVPRTKLEEYTSSERSGNKRLRLITYIFNLLDVIDNIANNRIEKLDRPVVAIIVPTAEQHAVENPSPRKESPRKDSPRNEGHSPRKGSPRSEGHSPRKDEHSPRKDESSPRKRSSSKVEQLKQLSASSGSSSIIIRTFAASHKSRIITVTPKIDTPPESPPRAETPRSVRTAPPSALVHRRKRSWSLQPRSKTSSEQLDKQVTKPSQ